MRYLSAKGVDRGETAPGFLEEGVVFRDELAADL